MLLTAFLNSLAVGIVSEIKGINTSSLLRTMMAASGKNKSELGYRPNSKMNDENCRALACTAKEGGLAPSNLLAIKACNVCVPFM